MKYAVPYYVEDGGDGSASVRFTKTAKEAREKDSEQEGFSEETAGTLEIEVRDGKVFYKTYDFDTYSYVEVELQPVKEKKKK